MPYIDTQPAVSTPEDHKKWRQPDDPGPRKFGDVKVKDPRVSPIINWLAVIGGGLVTAGLIWLISTSNNVDKQVGILLARPIPVSKEQYDSDLSEIKREMSTIKNDVKDIQIKQAEGIRNRP